MSCWVCSSTEVAYRDMYQLEWCDEHLHIYNEAWKERASDDDLPL